MQGRGGERVGETGAERHGREPPKTSHSRHNYKNQNTHTHVRAHYQRHPSRTEEKTYPHSPKRYKWELEIEGARKTERQNRIGNTREKRE